MNTCDMEEKKMMKKIGLILLALICLFAALSYAEIAVWDCPECGRKGNTGKFCGGCAHPAPWNESEKKVPTTVAVGDILTFGRYEQDSNLNNGMEPLEWIVLDYDETENKALLLSRFGLDAKPYHREDTTITWENCFLRSWLNGAFLETAFTEEERHAILKTDVDNSKRQGNSGWNTDGGSNTMDQFFLLSYQEVSEKYFMNGESRTCKVTPYAISSGVYTSNGNGWWWLRSPGRSQNYAARVVSDGSLGNGVVNFDRGCVRPACWLKLDSGVF